jgi:WD40 repeat protein
MIRPKWYLAVSILVLSSLAVNGCSFSVETLATPSPSEGFPSPTTAVVPVAETLPVATAPTGPATSIPAAATPTLIPIRLDTVPMLEAFQGFALEDVVHGLVFTPDGGVLAAAGGNAQGFSIRLWDVVQGTSLGTLEGHTGIVWSVAFSHDGKLLVSVSSDRTAKIWTWRQGTLLKSLDFPGQVVSASFSPDGQMLAVGGVDEPYNQIRNASIWTYSLDTWEPRFKYPEYWNITALAYSPRGGTLIGGGTSRNIRVWRTGDGTQVFTLNHAHQVSKAAISPDGSTVAAATCETVVNADCTEGGVWLWDLPTGRLNRKLGDFADIVENVAFSTDGSVLLAASRGGTLRFYSTADFQPVTELALPGGISALALSPDGGLLATGNTRGEVSVWKVVYHP